jgi:hypothetical protein
VYEPIAFNEKNQLVSTVLGLTLVRWPGNYRGVDATWLRWANKIGELFPTSVELVEQEKQRAENEKQRAEQAEDKLRQVAVNLLNNGMPIEQVAQLTGLDAKEILGE